MKLLSGIVLCLMGFIAHGQKKLITIDTYKAWSKLGEAGISPNGKYAWYQYAIGSESYLAFSTADGKYKKEFPKSTTPLFTNNSKYLIFQTTNGIGIFQTFEKKIEYISDAHNFIVPIKENNEWLSYRVKNDIVLRSIPSGEETKFPDATSGNFNPQGSTFVVRTHNEIISISLKDRKSKIISHQKAESLVFDDAGQQLAFLASTDNNNNIYLYKDGMDSAMFKLPRGLDNNSYKIASTIPNFSEDGRLLFFQLTPVDSLVIDPTIITDKLDVWNFNDAFLQSNQLIIKKDIKETRFTALMELETSKVNIIEDRNTQLIGTPTNNYALISNITNIDEVYWNTSQVVKYRLRSLKDNSSISITSNASRAGLIGISPSEKFISWYESLNRQYLTYEIATGDIQEITKDIPFPMYHENSNRAETAPTEVIGWLPNDTALLVCDRFDIWQVDPRRKKAPICLTNGFGRNHNIIFKRASLPAGLNVLPDGDTLLLTGLNSITKYNGFFRIKIGVQADPVPVGTMIPGVYYFPGIADRSSVPIKAENSDVYLIRRMSATEAPNLYITKDFNDFTAVSNFAPQISYNWLTASLVDFKLANGQKRSGILYKPENFDPRKKYPVILHYYEKKSNDLYVFLDPDLSRGPLSIPWYVSNGYLVFTPDIYYRPGHTGEDVLNSVVSGAKCLFNWPWVDTSNIGLQGHSMGGYETNYIVANSNIFKAAQSSAGISDLTQSFTGLGFGERSLARITTIGQLNMGVTPWQAPEKYIANSPIYNVTSVTTPLLLMHNKSDGAVPFGQSVGLFTSLRMLQKPVWLLQYDGEGHTVEEESCKLDFTIRQQQFFDHYLKGKPAPLWMTRGIKAIDKGQKSGLQLDTISQ